MNKKSASLLNIDATPAVFWITNPNNVFYGNRAAGSTHFGFWFNPPEDGPTGPSAREPEYENLCPKHRPLGAFYNNTAHSLGGFGLWIFSDLTPTGPNGDCGETTPKAIKFGALPESNENGPVPDTTYGFFAWNCLRGAEFATGGAIQFHNFIAANSWIAGMAGRETFLNTWADDDHMEEASLFKRSIVIGRLGGDPMGELDACGDMGIETPWMEFAFTVMDIEFYNFDETTDNLSSQAVLYGNTEHSVVVESKMGKRFTRRCIAFDPCYDSDSFDCGSVTWMSGVKWFNSPRRLNLEWEHEAVIYDRDGTFHADNIPDKHIVPKSALNDPSKCSPAKTEYNFEFPTEVCTGLKPTRFMFNNPSPPTLQGTAAVISNNYGETKSPFRNCRPRPLGWMALLDRNQEYSIAFEHNEHVSNITYQGDLYWLENDEYVTFRHIFPNRIDSVSVGPVGAADDDLGSEVDSWPSDTLSVDIYDFAIEGDNDNIAFYTINGRDQTNNPALTSSGGGLTRGGKYSIQPFFHSCFYEDCVVPTIPPATQAPIMIPCSFGESGCGPDSNTGSFTVSANQKVVLGRAAMEQNGYQMDLGDISLEGTLKVDVSEIPDGQTLTIAAPNFVSAPAGSARKRRDTVYVDNARLVIGTKNNPVPCGARVVIKVDGGVDSKTYGTLPGSVPIGFKAIGGAGGIQIHGCPISHTWTTLQVTVAAGSNTITVLSNHVIDWKVGDEIAIATSDLEPRHTEYFKITYKTDTHLGKTELGLNTTAVYVHSGAEDTERTIRGEMVNMASEVALLTRNVVIDGTGGSDGKHGARIIVSTSTVSPDGNHYVSRGFGQFSFVEFKGLGQFGYSDETDLRAQILFHNVQHSDHKSYVDGCSFHYGFNTAIAVMSNSDNIEISNNNIFNSVDSAVRIKDSLGVTIRNNLIADIEMIDLYQDYFNYQNGIQFGHQNMPFGILVESDSTPTIEGNHVAGVAGSCYGGYAEHCEASEACNGDSNWISGRNVGHSCLRGWFTVYNARSDCSKVSGFYFWNMLYYGVLYSANTPVVVIDNVFVRDAAVGIFSVIYGSDPVFRQYREQSVTTKNSYISGKGEEFECGEKRTYASRFADDMQSVGKVLSREQTHTGILIPVFWGLKPQYPIKMQIQDMETSGNSAYGQSCVVNTEFANFNRKCGMRDFAIRSSPENVDQNFPIRLISGNEISNVLTDDLVRFDRADPEFINIGDCSDMTCDGLKRSILIDEEGGFLGQRGTIHAESEHEWLGITRGSVTYSNDTFGVGDSIIPAAMRTTINGDPIPDSDVYTEAGIVRDSSCSYNEMVPGWFCADFSMEYHDLIIESLDEDYQRRRLSPVAVRSNGKYLDFINGPHDYSDCIGYSCSIRLSLFHTTVACGHEFEIFFSSTLPMNLRFHLPYTPDGCTIKVSIHAQRPNRLDLIMDGDHQLATNAEFDSNGNIKWNPPNRAIHEPSVSTHYVGSNFHDRSNQMVHMILAGGHIYELKTATTVVLQLTFATELTEEDFYDNGDLIANLAGLLGLDLSQIRLVEVVREDVGRKRRNGQNDVKIMFEIVTDDTGDQTKNANAANLDAARMVQMTNEIQKVASEVINEIDPNASTVSTVSINAAPVPAPAPEPVTPITATLGISTEGKTAKEKIDAVAKKLAENDLNIDDLTTELDRQQEEENAASSSSGLIVYQIPTTINIAEAPQSQQILGQTFFEPFVLTMSDDVGDLIKHVGFVQDPWKVRIELVDIILTDHTQPVQLTDEVANQLLTGTTVVDFKPGDGRAIFDDIVVCCSIKSTSFRFSLESNDPKSQSIGAIISAPTFFVEETRITDQGVTKEQEGSEFDKTEAWSPTCDFVCLSGVTFATISSPACNEVSRCEGTVPNPTYGSCSQTGCTCDMDSVPDRDSLDLSKFVHTTCDYTGLEVRLNKCVVNKIGFKLDDLYMVGPDRTADFTNVDSRLNKCRGALAYDNGPEYVFKLNREFSDCGTIADINGHDITYRNAIQGRLEFGGSNSVIFRQVRHNNAVHFQFL